MPVSLTAYHEFMPILSRQNKLDGQESVKKSLCLLPEKIGDYRCNIDAFLMLPSLLLTLP